MTEQCSKFSFIRSETITADFRRYLLEERGLSEMTLPYMIRFADQFLTTQFPGGEVDFSKLKPDVVTRFVQRQAAQLKSGRTKLLVTVLRTFFRYLRHRGYVDVDLAGCVPSVPEYSLSTLPKFLPPGSIERILKHCDRSIPQGRRDYAMLLLLARLGLRGGEVLRLTLDDVDWSLGEISIRGKGGRPTKFPLPEDVGGALADYLRRDRPCCPTRRLFLTLNRPSTGLSYQTAISTMVKRALVRAGVDSERKGAHVFRHTLATEMLQRGASLGEIGELLRHRNTNTTRIYAKVNLPALRKLALVWPGGAR